jgi:hypothetical protein
LNVVIMDEGGGGGGGLPRSKRFEFPAATNKKKACDHALNHPHKLVA